MNTYSQKMKHLFDPGPKLAEGKYCALGNRNMQFILHGELPSSFGTHSYRSSCSFIITEFINSILLMLTAETVHLSDKKNGEYH